MIIIEHNLEVIKTADWIIDLGPEGGNKGGKLVAVGTPEDVAEVKESYTGQYLKPYLDKRRGAASPAGPVRNKKPATGTKKDKRAAVKSKLAKKKAAPKAKTKKRKTGKLSSGN